MHVAELIRRKRDGFALTEGEIAELVAGVTSGAVPDYQTAALLMAVYFRGLGADELGALTRAMLESGATLDLSDVSAPKVDKHSTGGVGDKISIALAPAVAACGVVVPMVSGRGLGHTGGTLDKLESIPGFRTDLTIERAAAIAREHGIVLAGQSERLVPADRKLYALRDVTGTVESIPLIAASIMSKKLAEGVDGLVFDVKVGRGAFMKTLAEAQKLARTLIGIGNAAGKKTHALLTDMEQPIGHAIGNLCELVEAVDVLRGGGPADTRELVIELGAEMLVVAGLARDGAAAALRIRETIASGAALERFARVVRAQGGDPAFLDRPPEYAGAVSEVRAARTGFVARIDAEAVGMCAVLLGAGRTQQEDAIDPAVAIFVRRKVGEAVRAGELLATVHATRQRDDVVKRLGAAFTIDDVAPAPRPLIIERLA